jgi:hypothetical protein
MAKKVQKYYKKAKYYKDELSENGRLRKSQNLKNKMVTIMSPLLPTVSTAEERALPLSSHNCQLPSPLLPARLPSPVAACQIALSSCCLPDCPLQLSSKTWQQ